MSLFGRVVRGVGKAAEVTTSVAGAIGGAVISGTVGAVAGATAGVRRGLSEGSHSTPAAAAVIGALAVTGLVEWPVVVAVGGTALLLRQLKNASEETPVTTEPSSVTPLTRPASKTAESKPLKSVPNPPRSATTAAASATSTPTKAATKSAARPRKSPTKQPAHKPRPSS